MSGSPKVARNRRILAARAKGQRIRQIADAHGLSRGRVQQILKDGCGGRTLTLLPGTENLSSITRGLLVRLGYRSADAVLTGLRRGELHAGCTFGFSHGRLAEIAAWARKRNASGAD